MFDSITRPDFIIFFDYDHAQKSIIESILYSRNWFIRNISKVNDSVMSEAIFCYTLDDVNLKSEALYLLQKTGLRHCVVSMMGVTSILTRSNETIKISRIVDENDIRPVILYFIIQNMPYRFVREKTYHIVSVREDLQTGSQVQVLDGQVWVDMVVEDLDKEWKDLYSILSKYGRVRIQN
jgi:hypothetical protein